MAANAVRPGRCAGVLVVSTEPVGLRGWTVFEFTADDSGSTAVDGPPAEDTVPPSPPAGDTVPRGRSETEPDTPLPPREPIAASKPAQPRYQYRYVLTYRYTPSGTVARGGPLLKLLLRPKLRPRLPVSIQPERPVHASSQGVRGVRGPAMGQGSAFVERLEMWRDEMALRHAAYSDIADQMSEDAMDPSAAVALGD